MAYDSIDQPIHSRINIISPRQALPLFIAADVEGCITPRYRTEIDLRKFQRLRSYCEFVKSDTRFPQIVIYTGRSQGYVELLAQTLGMLNGPLDVPFVIENGAVLYRPVSMKTIHLITSEQLTVIHRAHAVLTHELPDNEFEPKNYMVTINTVNQPISELRDRIIHILNKHDLLESLHISSTASAVDITPKNISKLFGLKKVLDYFPNELQDYGLTRVVAVGDSLSDLEVLQGVGSAYCPFDDVDLEVRHFVERRFGAEHVISLPYIDYLIAVIEKECGLRIR